VDAPHALDLKKDQGLTIVWSDGARSYYPIAYLRKMSPSADMRQLREHMRDNPLTVLPSRPPSNSPAPLAALSAELVGNYALRIHFSDGHSTGIYSWAYLREIDRGDTPPSPSTTSPATTSPATTSPATAQSPPPPEHRP
jgi:DUF971 family protein